MAAPAPAAAPPAPPPPRPAVDDEPPPPTPHVILMAARVWARARAFMARHYLPVGLAYSTLFGFLVPAPGIAVSRTPVNTISICGIFFISGLQLQTEEVKKALRAYWAYTYGILAILLLSPLTSLLIAQLPFDPPELPLGQALFMAMPTTVSSGACRAVLRCACDHAQADLFTVAAPILAATCCRRRTDGRGQGQRGARHLPERRHQRGGRVHRAVLPVRLPHHAARRRQRRRGALTLVRHSGRCEGSRAAGSASRPFTLEPAHPPKIPLPAQAPPSSFDPSGAFNPVELLWKLTLSILLPLTIGRSLRYFDAVRAFVKAHKGHLKLLSSSLLIMVPWVVISTSAEQLRTIPGGSFFILVVLGVALHGGLLAGNYAVCRYVLRGRVALAERKSVVINASQKTINTAMSVIQFLPPSDVLGLDKGLLILPCLLSHFIQILMDAYLASSWKLVTEDEDDGVGGGRAPAAAAGAAPGIAVELAAGAPASTVVAAASTAGGMGTKLLAAPSHEGVDVRPVEASPWHDGPPGVASKAYR